MDDLHLARKYAPIIHFDAAETIPLVSVGYTIFREEKRSDSFPKRIVKPDFCGLVIEYALYWDFDIQHMYDLEHIWVWVAPDGRVTRAEGSFHGKYLTLWTPELPFARPVENHHVHAFCQPGKHAFMPDGELFRLIPGWDSCCNADAGGPVAVGAPFVGRYTPTARDDEHCREHIRRTYAFPPTLRFDEGSEIPEDVICPWESLKAWIPSRIYELCASLPK